MDKLCFVSIDVERTVENLDKILDIFQKYNVSATLFVTGRILEKYPELVRAWSRDFEIACHTFTHRHWDTISQKERETELENFNRLYGQVFNRKPAGFRAPTHIIDEQDIMLLQEKGFLYDSSIVPYYPLLKQYEGYQGRASLLPYHPAQHNCRSKGQMRLLEIPASGLLLGIPLAAAWFARLPLLFYKVLFTLRAPSFVNLSMHPWDIFKPGFLGKLEKILKLLKGKNYQFSNGREIYESVSKNR